MFDLVALELEGFKSYKKQTRIEFNNSPGLRFIAGKNEVDADLGSNGAGKSSIFDALTWCLTAATPRDGRAARVVSHGAKRARVMAEVQDGPRVVRVERTAPPDRLTINGEPATQEALGAILGGREAFLQSVVFGQTCPLFFDLSIPDRRTLLDDVCRLGLWIELSDKAILKARQLTADVGALREQVRYAEGKLAGIPDASALTRDSEAWEADRETRLTAALDALERAERALDVAQTAAARFEELTDMAELKKQIAEQLDGIIRLRTEKERLATYCTDQKVMSQFYLDNRKCPTCEQAISRSFADKQRVNADAEVAHGKVKIAEADSMLNVCKTHHADLNKQFEEATANNARIVMERRTASQRVGDAEDKVKQMAFDVETVGESKNPYAPQIERIQSDRAAAIQLLREATDMLNKKEGELIPVEYWKQGFKKVQLYLIKRILTQLEMESNNAAASLGLTGWKIRFSTEIENKSGTLRSGIHITIDAGQDRAGREFSPGELQRVRLSVAFGLASVIQQLSGIYWSMETYDEPTAGLSVEGVEDLLECLTFRAETTKKTIYVIDHHTLSYGFDEIWTVTKTSSGSSVHVTKTLN